MHTAMKKLVIQIIAVAANIGGVNIFYAQSQNPH